MKLKHAAPILLLAVCHPVIGAANEVSVCTDMGRFTVELYPDHAPAHVRNFLGYVDQDFYSNTAFHRVINGFLIQGGGYDRGLRIRQPGPPVENESRNGLSNERGTVAAARAAGPHSASSQFYINLRDNPALDGTEDDWGHTVFGRVREGMEVVDEIARLPTGGAGPFARDVPDPLVAVRWMTRLDRAALRALPADAREDAIRANITAAEDPSQVIEWMGHLRAICVRPEVELLLTEAEAALELERPRRALAALAEYVSTAPEDHAGREDAEALYARLVEATTPSLSEQARELVGRCVAPQPADIPDGGTASLEEMRAGQQRVQTYVTESEAYLDCLAAIIDDEADLSAEDRDILISQHNAVVDAMEGAAEQFNSELATFRAREDE